MRGEGFTAERLGELLNNAISESNKVRKVIVTPQGTWGIGGAIFGFDMAKGVDSEAKIHLTCNPRGRGILWEKWNRPHDPRFLVASSCLGPGKTYHWFNGCLEDLLREKDTYEKIGKDIDGYYHQQFNFMR